MTLIFSALEVSSKRQTSHALVRWLGLVALVICLAVAAAIVEVILKALWRDLRGGHNQGYSNFTPVVVWCVKFTGNSLARVRQERANHDSSRKEMAPGSCPGRQHSRSISAIAIFR